MFSFFASALRAPQRFFVGTLALLTLAAAPLAAAPAAPAPAAAKHKLFLLDESRPQILFVDEATPANDWALPVKGTHVWGFQLVGDNRVLVALKDFGGFREYDLGTRKVVANVVNKSRYGQVSCALRLPDGGTLIASPRKHDSQYALFDKALKEVARWKFPFGGVRQIRLTPRGTVLASDGGNSIYEFSIAERKILRQRKVPGAKQIFQVSELPNGNLLVSAGYAGFLGELGWEGDIVRRWGVGNPKSAALGTPYYMSQFQVLKNGNIIVATWTGHGANDSRKHQQVVEFAPDGTVLWKWHNPKAAGSIHGVIAPGE